MKNQHHATHHLHVKCCGKLYTIATGDIVEITELFHDLMHIQCSTIKDLSNEKACA